MILGNWIKKEEIIFLFERTLNNYLWYLFPLKHKDQQTYHVFISLFSWSRPLNSDIALRNLFQM